MERRRRFVRLAAASAVALVLAGGAAACSSGPLAPDPAATVNGAEITRQDVQDEVDATTAFYADAADAELSDTDYAALADAAKGEGADTTSRSATTQALLTLIQDELVRQELEAADALPDEAAKQTVRDGLVQQLGADTLEQLDTRFIDRYVESTALAQALQQLRAEEANAAQEAPDPAEVEAQRDARYEELLTEQPYCFRVIRTASEAEAQAALDRVEGGEDFAAVAADTSVLADQFADAFVGCGSAEQLQNALGVDVTGAQEGDRFGPLTTTGSNGEPAYDVVEVAGTSGPTREQAQAQLETEIPSTVTPVDAASIDLQTEVSALLAEADVWVDPRYGTWNAESQLLEDVVGAVTTTAPPTVAGS